MMPWVVGPSVARKFMVPKSASVRSPACTPSRVIPSGQGGRLETGEEHVAGVVQVSRLIPPRCKLPRDGDTAELVVGIEVPAQSFAAHGLRHWEVQPERSEKCRLTVRCAITGGYSRVESQDARSGSHVERFRARGLTPA